MSQTLISLHLPFSQMMALFQQVTAGAATGLTMKITPSVRMMMKTLGMSFPASKKLMPVTTALMRMSIHGGTWQPMEVTPRDTALALEPGSGLAPQAAVPPPSTATALMATLQLLMEVTCSSSRKFACIRTAMGPQRMT